MTEIKAIETVYDNHKFRSRLEARWAVFFKTLGVKYEYEKEGYEINGCYYLPDFFLPEIPLWVEAKGEGPTYLEILLLSMLADNTKNRGTIVGGIRNYLEEDVYSGDWERYHTAFLDEDISDAPYFFCECRYCGAIGFEWSGYGSRINCCTRNKEVGDYATSQSPRLVEAYRTAIQARFEHGEKG